MTDRIPLDPWEASCVRRLEMLRDMLSADVKHSPVLVSLYCLLVIEAAERGRWRALWWHAKHVIQLTWGFFKVSCWYFWHQTLLRKTRTQLDELVDKETYGCMTKEERLEVELAAEEVVPDPDWPPIVGDASHDGR